LVRLNLLEDAIDQDLFDFKPLAFATIALIQNDRTGTVIAAYHVEYDKWDNARALMDAKAHSMSFFEFPRQNFIKNFRQRTVEAKAMSPADANTAAPSIAAIPATAEVRN